MVTRLLCLLLGLSASVVFAESLKPVNEKKHGYLLEVPNSWRKEMTGRSTTSKVVSRSGNAAVIVEMRNLGYGEESAVVDFKNELTRKFRAFPGSVHQSYQDGVSVYDFENEAKENGNVILSHVRLMCYKDENVALVIDGKCTVDRDMSECKQVRGVMNSFWVYNKSKFSEKYAKKPSDYKFRTKR